MGLNIIEFLAAPTAMCLLLAGIHCYLGLHVLARGVIFVDLSLAQVAAFGATLALFCGFEHNGVEAYFFSLTAAFLAATLFALARKYERTISQEAIIGIVYAFGAAAIVLAVDRLAHGAEHIKEILVGQILWVTWFSVAKTAAIYAAVAVVHYVFRRQLLAASFGQPVERRSFWDFMFYALFGAVITSSVSYVGVLQVFAYLIVPALVASQLFSTVRGRLIFGWIMGSVLSVIGMALSYLWDFPTGAFLVVCFALVPILLLILLPLVRMGL